MGDKKLFLSPSDSFKIWTYNNLELIKPNYYKGNYQDSNIKLSHESYTAKDLYHISIQKSYSKEYEILDFRTFNLPYFNFVYLIEGKIESNLFQEGHYQYKIDEWAFGNSKFNDSHKSNIVYKRDSDMTFLHITLLEPILRYYMEYDTPFSPLIEKELAKDSEKILYMDGKYNPIIKSIIYTIINNINKGPIGDKIIQIKVDELFLIVLPELLKSKISTIDNIEDYIRGHFHERLTINQISKLFNVSEYYVREGIKQKNNSTFNNYLKMIRLEKAHELFHSDKEFSFNQIASLVGYSNPTRLKNELLLFNQEKELGSE